MPHLNELQDEYGDQGLTVLAVTGESASQTEPWIEKHGAEFPYAYYKGSKLKSFAQVSGIPAAMLVNPEGKVVWRGHPSSVTGALIAEHLDGAMPFPLFDFPKHASKVKKALLSKKLAAALEEAQELVADDEPDAARILSAVEGLISNAVESLKTAHDEGNFLKVADKGPDLIKSLDELPQAAEIQALVDAVDEDDHAQEVIEAQQRILKIEDGVEKLKKRSQVDKLVDKLNEIREEFPDSFVAGQAEELIASLSKLRPQLK